MRHAILLAVAVSISGPMLPALGRYDPASRPRGADIQSQRSAVRQPARDMCERACLADPSPCDPLVFKLADGRCKESNGG